MLHLKKLIKNIHFSVAVSHFQMLSLLRLLRLPIGNLSLAILAIIVRNNYSCPAHFTDMLNIFSVSLNLCTNLCIKSFSLCIKMNKGTCKYINKKKIMKKHRLGHVRTLG